MDDDNDISMSNVEETINSLKYFVGDATPENVEAAKEYYLNPTDNIKKYNFDIYTEEEWKRHYKLFFKAIDLWEYRFKRLADVKGASK